MTFRLHTRINFPMNDLDLFIIHEDRTGNRAMVTSLTMFALAPAGNEPLNAGKIIDPVYGRQRDFLKAILDGAWEAGLRPTGYGDVNESLKAKDSHLQDMRAITFHKLGMKQA